MKNEAVLKLFFAGCCRSGLLHFLRRARLASKQENSQTCQMNRLLAISVESQKDIDNALKTEDHLLTTL